MTAAAEDDAGVLSLRGCVHAAPGTPISQHPHHAPGAQSGLVSAEVSLDAASGQLLDARSSCCPGGFHAVLGSFCPAVTALLLAAAAADKAAPGGLAAAAEAAERQLAREQAAPVRCLLGLGERAACAAAEAVRMWFKGCMQAHTCCAVAAGCRACCPQVACWRVATWAVAFMGEVNWRTAQNAAPLPALVPPPTHARLPCRLAPPPPTQPPLPAWEGPALQQALRARPFKLATARLLPQLAPPRLPPPSGAGWGAGKDMASGVKLNSRRTGIDYDRYYGARWAGRGWRVAGDGGCHSSSRRSAALRPHRASCRGHSAARSPLAHGTGAHHAAYSHAGMHVLPLTTAAAHDPKPHPTRPVPNVGAVDRPPPNVEDASDDISSDPLWRNADQASLLQALKDRWPGAGTGSGGGGGGGCGGDAGARAHGSSAGGGRASEGGVGALSAALMREGAGARRASAAGGSVGGAGGGGSSGGAGASDAAAKASEAARQAEAVVRLFAGDNLLMYNGTAVRGYSLRPVVSALVFFCGAARALDGTAQHAGMLPISSRESIAWRMAWPHA